VNALQRRTALRSLQRRFPMGAQVRRWYMPHTALTVAGYTAHHVVTHDTEGPEHCVRYTLPSRLVKS